MATIKTKDECVGQDLNLGTTKDQHLKLALLGTGGEQFAHGL